MRMRTILYIILSILPFTIAGQTTHSVQHLSADSLAVHLMENWQYHAGDDATWAKPEYDDSGWDTANLMLRTKDVKRLDFDGIGWFRMHVDIDSTLVNKQLAFSVTQAGASEIYIDGKLLVDYGIIGSCNDSCQYFSPQNKPATFSFTTSGEHLIAVRFAKYDARYIVNKYQSAAVGALITMDTAENAINRFKKNLILYGMVFLTFLSLFLALGFVHFMLWLFYRADKSNLYFSLFCLSLSFSALAFYMPLIASNPQLSVWGTYAKLISFLLIFLCLSGLSNYLFSKKQTRFYIMGILTLITIVVTYIAPNIALSFIGILIMTLIVESIMVCGRALFKRLPGSGIVGVGVLFFTAFLMLVTILSVIGVPLDVDDSARGILFGVMCVLALLSTPISMSIYLARKFATTNKSLKEQLTQVQLLSEKNMQQEQEKKRLLETQNERLEQEVKERTKEITEEKHKSDELLRNILPEEIAEELKEKGSSEARYFDHVSVIFTDFVNFTKAGERLTAQQLVNELDTCFKAFDDIMSKYDIEKIKTIGDAYLAVCGLPVAVEDHAAKTVQAAMDIVAFMQQRKEQHPDTTFDIRIGIHSGPVVAGIVGVKKFAYDIWGDTVNTAARMESAGVSGKVNISAATYELVKDKFNCTYRGEIAAKNKGELDMYFVDSLKS